MVCLSWNLARNIVVRDPELHSAIKRVLRASLDQVTDTLELLRHLGVKVRFHGRKKTEATHYCLMCDEEVFDLLLVRDEEKVPTPYCLGCARRQDWRLRGFACLEEYNLEELYDVCDKFVLSK